MRIRKRPLPAVEVARAAPVLENKPSASVPKSLHAEVQITHRSERLDGGSAELSPVVSEKRHTTHREPLEARPNSSEQHVDDDEDEQEKREENGNKKQELRPRSTPPSSVTGTGTGTELLMKSLLVVFERAGNRGLTAREAVAKLVEYDLPGLQEGERSSVQVAKVLRTPDFVHLEDGKYFIYPTTPHAVVAESSTQSEPSGHDSHVNSVANLTSGRRKRAAAAKVVFSDGSKDNTSEAFSDKNAVQVELKKRRRRPPSSQHELAIGPRQCKRYDGRGWQCTRETEEGFSFCEHHQALMNKRTLRLNLVKKRRKGGTDIDLHVEQQQQQQPKASASVAEGSGSRNNNNNNNNNNNSSSSSKKSLSTNSRDHQQQQQQQLVVVSPHGIEDLIHNQRRRLVKARSLKSIK